MATRLYLSNDTSARAAGAAALADAWAERPDLQLIRTSSRGAFFLEPMVERDSAAGRIAWFNVTQDDLPRILAGTGGTPVEAIPFLARQTRIAFANSARRSPWHWMNTRRAAGFRGCNRPCTWGRTPSSRNSNSPGCVAAAAPPFRCGISGWSHGKLKRMKSTWWRMPTREMPAPTVIE